MREAIILAGGLGTRLKSIVHDTPKPMAIINGKPFLNYILDQLDDQNFDRVILSVAYQANYIIKYYSNQYKNLKIEYSIEEEPLGTGGAIKKSLELVLGDYSFIINGDTYIKIQASMLETLWGKSKRPIILGIEVENTERFGKILVKNNNLVGFKEKGINGKGIINGGLYIFPKSILSDYPKDTYFSIESDFILKKYKEVLFKVLISKSKFIDIGVPEDYYLAQELLKK
jgi:D-glycero-alpha-D-manno-heptose 1-phosphate guanylyltransferase